MKDGCLDIPDRPGLGITLNMEFLSSHTFQNNWPSPFVEFTILIYEEN